MRVAVGSDHAGFELKRLIVSHLREKGHEVDDVGTHNADPVDYPVFAERVGLAVADGQADRGVIICGSGVGAAVAANKVPGIRAGLCHDTYSAHQGVEHDDINVLVLGARIIGIELAKELVQAFFGASFSNEDRHRRRLDLVNQLEAKYSGKET